MAFLYKAKRNIINAPSIGHADGFARYAALSAINSIMIATTVVCFIIGLFIYF